MTALPKEALLEAAGIDLFVRSADCAHPLEKDDALAVEVLPGEREMYRVSVACVDMSELMTDPAIRGLVFENLDSQYGVLPNGRLLYEPMVPRQIIRAHELEQGAVRSAVVVSFTVGDGLPPGDTSIDFKPVYVEQNHNYRGFDNYCRENDEGRKFARAAGFIIRGLGYVPEGDKARPSNHHLAASDLLGELKPVRRDLQWFRGARINEAFMIATNHLVGKLLAAENSLAIHRVYDPSDTRFREFFPAHLAWYSSTPGPHRGLKLEPICRVTSGLRRGTDAQMGYLLRLRDLGTRPTPEDIQATETLILRQNVKNACRVLGITALADVGPALHERLAEVIQFPVRNPGPVAVNS